jgi:carboxypeptidase Taq
MTPHEETYVLLTNHFRDAKMLASIQELLEWDERTKMPPANGEYRADQAAYIAGLVHQKQTAPIVGDWLATLADSPLASDPISDTGAVIKHLYHDYEKKTRLPQSLVEELTRTGVQGQQLWAASRKANDFAAFRPLLAKMVDLKKQEAAALGYTTTPYDPLLDDYEPGETTANVACVLSELRKALVPLVHAIRESKFRPDTTILSRTYPTAAQETFGKLAATKIGFDFQAGRLDVTDHPFCAGLGPGDVRLTTRYDEHAFPDGFFSILHEAGHGIYDQGLPREFFGLPTGDYVSLGIHESQSRMWENQVGRSRAFWEYFFPHAQAAFPGALASTAREDFYAAVNDSRPSLIRVEADEVTYNLHILIRFELEKALLEDDLQVDDLPVAWQQKYQEYLGVVSPTDTDGVLQDVHWSAGLFGYFPTYALGNLYAAQFFAQAKQELGNLDGQFQRGEFSELREWLRVNMHTHGRRFTPAELVERITGKPLSHAPLMEHLTTKYGELYGL